jgi:hypothetical protein
MSSRRSSVGSSRGSIRGAGTRNGAYACRHELSGSRVNGIIAQLPIQTKTKKCPDCQTTTATGMMNLLQAMQNSASMKETDPVTLRQMAQYLFDRLAAQRKSTETGFKDRYDEVLLKWAVVCYIMVPVNELRSISATIRSKWGSGMDRQVMQALGQAACFQNRVLELLPSAESPALIGINHTIRELGTRLDQIDRFQRVEDMMKNAEELGRLADDTVGTLDMIARRFGRWDHARK